MLEVAEGVQYLHSGGLVHGDLHGVSLYFHDRLNQSITLRSRGMSSLILNSTAKSLILEQFNILILLLHARLPSTYISLRLNYLARASRVAYLIVTMNATVLMCRIKQRKLIYLLLAAFIIQCV